MTVYALLLVAFVVGFDSALILWLWWMTRRQEQRRRRAYREYLHGLRKAGM